MRKILKLYYFRNNDMIDKKKAKNEIIKELENLTGKRFIALTESGDHSIKHGYKLAKKLGKEAVLMQDQGGWLTYGAYASKEKLIPLKIKTDYGLFNIEELAKKTSVKTVLIVNSLSGYFAEQNMTLIKELCEKTSCLLINDISGSVGTEIAKIGDIIICSFGRYKPINAGYGGCIATDNEEWLKLLEGFSFNERNLAMVLREIKKMPERIKFFEKTAEKIKKDLKDHEIIHKKSRAINVIVKFNNETEKEEIIKYCQENNYPYEICPREIRVLDNAVSIEVKRLNMI